jgi:hypothetical protein
MLIVATTNPGNEADTTTNYEPTVDNVTSSPSTAGIHLSNFSFEPVVVTSTQRTNETMPSNETTRGALDISVHTGSGALQHDKEANEISPNSFQPVSHSSSMTSETSTTSNEVVDKEPAGVYQHILWPKIISG